MQNEECRVQNRPDGFCILRSRLFISKLVEPEVVATSPCRIKSPVPVCCGFGSIEVARQAEAQRAKAGARGPALRDTCTGPALSGMSLLLDYASLLN